MNLVRSNISENHIRGIKRSIETAIECNDIDLFSYWVNDFNGLHDLLELVNAALISFKLGVWVDVPKTHYMLAKEEALLDLQRRNKDGKDIENDQPTLF